MKKLMTALVFAAADWLDIAEEEGESATFESEADEQPTKAPTVNARTARTGTDEWDMALPRFLHTASPTILVR